MDVIIEKILNEYRLDINAIDEINSYISKMYDKMMCGLLSDDEIADFLINYGSYKSSHDTLVVAIRRNMLDPLSIPKLSNYTYDTAINKMRKSIHDYIINNSSFDIYSNADAEIYSVFKEMCLDSNNRCSINRDTTKRLNPDILKQALANKDIITVYSKDYIHKQNKRRRG